MSGDNGGLPLGATATVSVEVGRNELPGFIREVIVDALVVDLDGAPEGYVYLPHTALTFGKVRGKGTIGQFQPEPNHLFRSRSDGAYLKLRLSALGDYFGWNVHGVRLEFTTNDGETYTVVVSYDIDSSPSEGWRLALVDIMLRVGRDSCAYALTEAAAKRTYSRYYRRPEVRTAGKD